MASFPEIQVIAIGQLRSGALASLTQMDAATAEMLSGHFAGIDPWARIGMGAERLRSLFTSVSETARCHCLRVNGQVAGAIVTRDAWLAGSYLPILAVLPQYQGQGVGFAALGWFEQDARGKGARNLWLTAATFNSRAIATYERFGFIRAGLLEGLLAEGCDEVLLRKVLSPAPKPLVV